MAKLGPKYRSVDFKAGLKRCPKCEQWKPFTEFWSDAGNHTGRSGGGCKACMRAYHKEYRKRDPERQYHTNARSGLRDMCRKVGITVAQYEQALADQGGVCKICLQPQRDGRMRRLTIDHDHVTGEFRGLLCANCNKALGNFGDSIAIMEAAIEYLRASKPLFQVIDGTAN